MLKSGGHLVCYFYQTFPTLMAQIPIELQFAKTMRHVNTTNTTGFFFKKTSQAVAQTHSKDSSSLFFPSWRVYILDQNASEGKGEKKKENIFA